MKTLQKFGGFAALYLAVVNLVGMVLFLVVLNYPSITDPAQKVALLVNKQSFIFSTNLLMYVFFGIILVVLSLALYDRLKSGAPALMQVATVFGIIWAGSLIASGMVANAGIAPVVALYAKDPTQAALTWQGIESVTNGLGNFNGEILGGLLTLLVSLGRAADWRASQGPEYSRLVSWLGGHHLPYPRIDRPDDRSFWLEPSHLVRLAGNRVATQRLGQDSVKLDEFSQQNKSKKEKK